MPLLHLAILAAIQAITEFLPISSSAHLILVPHLTGWEDQGLAVDIAVHVGTLFAVMLYFWRDMGMMIKGGFSLILGKTDQGAKLAFYIIIATLPVVIAGYLMKDYISGSLRSVEVIGWTMVGFGILLYIADKSCMTVRRIEHLNFGSALFIGLGQVLALIPGTSRAGITMTCARMLGFERADSARFSMLLAIPTIIGAGLLLAKDIVAAGDFAMSADLAILIGLSFIIAYITIIIFMSWIKRASFTPFVIYRVLFGAGLLVWYYYYM